MSYESGGMSRILSVFLLLLSVSPAWAAPSAAQATDLVQSVVDFSLTPRGEVSLPAEWSSIEPHAASFDPEFFTLLEWCSTPQPDADGREWHIDVDPIWQVQTSGVKDLRVGTPKPEGDLQTVVLDYEAPSFREGRPAAKYHAVWVVGEVAGKPVLKDIRYHVKRLESTHDGSVLADMRKARQSFKAPKK